MSGFSPCELAAWLVTMKLLVSAATDPAGPGAGLAWADAPLVPPPVLPDPKALEPVTEAPCCLPPPLDEEPPPNCELKVPRLAPAWLAAFWPLNWSPPDEPLPLAAEPPDELPDPLPPPLPDPVVEAEPPLAPPAEPLPEVEDPPFVPPPAVLAWPPETDLPVP